MPPGESLPLAATGAGEASASAASIVDFVARARRRRNLRTALECASLGIAAGAVAVAAAALSRVPQTEGSSQFSDLVACGVLCGLAAAGTWWVERAKKSDLDLARQLDARLERDGALSTVYEARARGDRGAVGRWLENRVIAGLAPGSLSRALPAPGWIWLAPPAIGMALAAFVFESPARSIATGLATSLDATLGANARAMARATLALERARDLRALALNDAGLRAQLIAELDTAADELERLRDLDGPDFPAPDTGAGLSERIAAERSSLTGDRPIAPAVGQAGDPAPGGASVGPGVGAGAGSQRDGGKSLLTNGSPDRTMSGSNRSTAAAAGARSAPGEPETGSAPEAGTIAGRWWPERYDPVVQGWRRALAAREEHR